MSTGSSTTGSEEHERQVEGDPDWCIVEEVEVPDREAPGQPPVLAELGTPRRDLRLPARFGDYDLANRVDYRQLIV